MSKTETKALSGSYSDLRKILVEKHIVEDEKGFFVFKAPYEFTSPSNAASILLGYSTNGRLAWKTETGKTLKELEEEIIKNDIAI